MSYHIADANDSVNIEPSPGSCWIFVILQHISYSHMRFICVDDKVPEHIEKHESKNCIGDIQGVVKQRCQLVSFW